MPNVILATAGYDNTIRFWEAPSGVCQRTLQVTPDSQINQIEICPNNKYIAAVGNPFVRFYDLATSKNNTPVRSYEGHTTNVMALGFEEEGKWMYTGSEDSTIKIWDLRANGAQREYKCNSPVNSVCLHPNQVELISGHQNGSIRVWDLTANTCSRELVPDGEVAVRSITVAPDASHCVAANNKGKCFVWKMKGNDTSLFEPIQCLQAHKTFTLKCLCSPDSKLLATTSADQSIKLWEMKSGKYQLANSLIGHQRWVWDCVFSNDSLYLVSASSDHSARLWDTSQGDSIRHYAGHHKAVVCVALRDI